MNYRNIPADQSGFITVPGGRIWYRANGLDKKATPLLIIHGGPGNTHDYLLPCLELMDERPLIFYDQLDSGQSDTPNKPENWHIDRFSDEIDAIREALHLNALALLASSWGSSIALNYAARAPKGLEAVIVSGPLVNTERWIRDNEIYRQHLPEDIRQTLLTHEKTASYDHPDYQAAVMFYYNRHLCRVHPWPEYVQYAMDATNVALYQTMWGPTEFLCTGLLKDLDLVPLLPGIQTPTLFISGEFDEGTPQATQEFAALMPNGKAITIPDASHMPHVEQPALFFSATSEFLQQADK